MKKLCQSHFEKLIKQLIEYNGMCYHLSSIFSTYNLSREKLKKDGLKVFDDFILGSTLYYRDPITRKLIGGEQYNVGLKNLKDALQDINPKISNYYSSQSYECFETYLRSITAILIVENQSDAILIDERLGFNNVKSCRLFLKTHFKDNID